ncbi:hypothetical protein GGTG_13806 [Gaeumannomyces tritici R3-111a-1]|uniref:Uncharacterized protein n=1 Tax=Gaeumannomyces tritici (strain R3-111a-1) TaxID=644352 RepID=J3PJW5_GAET3|nr:hypothetical protein GGTG_13806 [Gaeumannomyces tritici R3-111a-1]EJT68616.1 hypothetical protein GGTG_13806 [Gaeumannomyces tritici R3-111a-1]
MKLLRWIEQKRQAMMDLGGNPAASSDRAGTADPRAASARAVRKREKTPPLALGKRRQNLETRLATQAGNSTLDSGETGAGGASARRSRHPPSISGSDGYRDGDPDGDRAKAGLTNGLATSTVSHPPPRLPTPSSSSTCAFKTPDAGPKDAVPGTSSPGHDLHVVTPYNTATTRPPRGRKRRREMDAEKEKEGRPIKTRNTRTTSRLHQPRINVGPLRQTAQNPAPPVATDQENSGRRIRLASPRPDRTRALAYDFSDKPRRSRRCLGMPPEYGLLEEGKAHRAARPGPRTAPVNPTDGKLRGARRTGTLGGRR